MKPRSPCINFEQYCADRGFRSAIERELIVIGEPASRAELRQKPRVEHRVRLSPRLLSGELRVKMAERLVEDSADV